MSVTVATTGGSFVKSHSVIPHLADAKNLLPSVKFDDGYRRALNENEEDKQD